MPGDLLPEGVNGTIGLRPGPGRGCAEPELQAIYVNLIHAAVHAAEIRGRTGRRVRLALEPEKCGLFESTAQTVRFPAPLVGAFPDQFGVCFDAGHSAFGFEELTGALTVLERAGIPVVKLRLGSLTRGDRPHPVAVLRGKGKPTFHRALEAALSTPVGEGDEWRLQAALHEAGDRTLSTTADELPGVLDWLAPDPERCPHLEVGSLFRERLPSKRSTGQAVR